MTITREEIRTTVTRYLRRYPDETGHLGPLLRSLDTDADVTSRSEFRGGHVTCGAVVVDHHDRLLLIRHKALDSWLLPGGHIEPGDVSLPGVARRELAEETGISRDDATPLPDQDPVPMDIDLHAIPANAAKGEPAHWHADFRFAFTVSEPEIRTQVEEVNGYAWRPRTDAPTPKLAVKLAGL